jgi:decaprenyl-phosphate phosphoribosyltransferase
VTTSTEAVDTPDKRATTLPGRGRPSVLVGLVRLARPRQWIKNLLVFVAPGAAGVLLHWPVLWRSAAAFGIFCLAASGTYFVNDVIDADADRRHPVKRRRPVAAGVVPVPLALTVGAILLAASLVTADLLAGWHLALVMAVYAAVNIAYSLELKHEPVVDVVAVSAGFVLRAIAGGVATDVALSNWFLIVASFGSLLVVTGKRAGEKQLLDDNQTDQSTVRQTLASYTSSYLRSVWTLSAAVTVTAYCLWAFERASQVHPGHHPIWFELSIVPFVIALLHVLRLLDSGRGAAPEDLALHDHRLQLYGVCWVGLFAIGAYAR